MSPSLKPATQDRLKRFNSLFPLFYEQFVSSETQITNLRLAYRLYKTRQAVILSESGGPKRTVFHVVYRNQSALLRDLFGVVTAYKLQVINLSIYGQTQPPTLIFVKLTVAQGNKALSEKMINNVRRAMQEALRGRFEVEDVIATERLSDATLEGVQTEFYIDQVFRLPALLVQAKTQTELYYKVMNALAQEDVLVVNTNLLEWHGSLRLIFYVLSANATPIPDYVGHKLADSLKRELSQ